MVNSSPTLSVCDIARVYTMIRIELQDNDYLVGGGLVNVDEHHDSG